MAPWQEHRSRTGCMLCYPLEERRLIGPHRNQWHSWPVLTQPKLNGERARFLDGFLLSSTEEPIYSVPHIVAELSRLNPPFELDGELYLHGATFEEIHSIVSRRVNQHEESSKLEYHVFDCVFDDLPSAPMLMRAVELAKWFRETVPLSSCVKLVPSRLAADYSRVLEHFDDYLANSYEGIIVRHPEAPYSRKRTQFCLKFKPKQQDDYRVVGFEEEHDKHGLPKNRLGKLLLEGSNNDRFSVYSGFDDELRATLWQQRESLIGRTITVYYQSLTTDRRVPCFGRVNSKELKLLWKLN